MVVNRIGELPMNHKTIFRAFFILAAIALTTIRLYYQSKTCQDKRKVDLQEGRISFITASIAALITVVFGLEYIFSPGFFGFAYLLDYPEWLRWIGAFLLGGGVSLLGISHHHLDRSFYSLVAVKEEQELIETGPYRWIRHPIYTAYLLNYIGGGLLSSNLVLTFVPFVMYAIMVSVRMGQEENILSQLFGERYEEYKGRTGRLMPKIWA